MKLKLAALLSLIMLGIGGCSSDFKTSNTNSAPATANTSSTPQTIAQNNPNIIDASANPTDSTGGTKEGCKCSAVGMTCNNKEGEKGCCGGKDGACSAERGGISDCCSTDKDGGACCSVAKMQGMDHKNMPQDKAAPENKTGGSAPR